MSYNNGPKIVTNGLVLYLDAANNRSIVSGSNTWFDLSRNGYNGTLTNGPTYTSSFGGNIVFDGTNDYSVSANSIRLGGQNATRTVEIAFYLPSTLTNNGYLLSNNRAGGGIGHALFKCNTASLSFELNATPGPPYTYTANASATGFSYIKVNNWNIVSWGMTIGTTTMSCKYMINGYIETINNNSITYSTGNDSPNDKDVDVARWRNYVYSTEYSSCQVATVRVYDRVLSNGEQLQNYHASKGRFGL